MNWGQNRFIRFRAFDGDEWRVQFQVYGSKGFIKPEGMTHVAGTSSEERRFEPLVPVHSEPSSIQLKVPYPKKSVSISANVRTSTQNLKNREHYAIV
jgi:hypothetical protein